MINTLKYFTLCFITLLMAACGKDDPEKVFIQEDVTLSGLTVSSISLDNSGTAATGSTTTFSVNCAAVPSATADVDWLSVNRVSSANKVHTFSVTASANTSTEARTGTVTVKAGTSTAAVTVSQAGAPPAPEPEKDQALLGLNAIDIARQFKAGWNIGNTLEACNADNKTASETMWGNPKINQSYIDGIKAAGFNFVRIPCAWDFYIIDDKNTIDPEWLDRVNEVVGMVTDAGMFAIVNIHWDGGWLENNIGTTTKSDLLNKQKSLWTQIATRLGHYNERLLFAGLNEPNAENAAQTSTLLQYEQAFIDAVRATGGNNSRRTLIFQGPSTNIDHTADYFKTNPNDPAGDGYMMAEIHYYDPYQYALMEEDADWSPVYWFWGEGYHVEGSPRNATWGEEDYMMEQFDKMKTRFAAAGIPVIIGEFGAYPNEHEKSGQTDADKAAILKSRAYYYSCVQQFGIERGLLPFVWDTGELINRNNGEVKVPEIIDAMMKVADTQKSFY